MAQEIDKFFTAGPEKETYYKLNFLQRLYLFVQLQNDPEIAGSRFTMVNKEADNINHLLHKYHANFAKRSLGKDSKLAIHLDCLYNNVILDHNNLKSGRIINNFRTNDYISISAGSNYHGNLKPIIFHFSMTPDKGFIDLIVINTSYLASQFQDIDSKETEQFSPYKIHRLAIPKKEVLKAPFFNRLEQFVDDILKHRQPKENTELDIYKNLLPKLKFLNAFEIKPSDYFTNRKPEFVKGERHAGSSNKVIFQFVKLFLKDEEYHQYKFKLKLNSLNEFYLYTKITDNLGDSAVCTHIISAIENIHRDLAKLLETKNVSSDEVKHLNAFLQNIKKQVIDAQNPKKIEIISLKGKKYIECFIPQTARKISNTAQKDSSVKLEDYHFDTNIMSEKEIINLGFAKAYEKFKMQFMHIAHYKDSLIQDLEEVRFEEFFVNIPIDNIQFWQDLSLNDINIFIESFLKIFNSYNSICKHSRKNINHTKRLITIYNVILVIDKINIIFCEKSIQKQNPNIETQQLQEKLNSINGFLGCHSDLRNDIENELDTYTTITSDPIYDLRLKKVKEYFKTRIENSFETRANADIATIYKMIVLSIPDEAKKEVISTAAVEMKNNVRSYSNPRCELVYLSQIADAEEKLLYATKELVLSLSKNSLPNRNEVILKKLISETYSQLDHLSCVHSIIKSLYDSLYKKLNIPDDLCDAFEFVQSRNVSDKYQRKAQFNFDIRKKTCRNEKSYSPVITNTLSDILAEAIGVNNKSAQDIQVVYTTHRDLSPSKIILREFAHIANSKDGKIVKLLDLFNRNIGELIDPEYQQAFLYLLFAKPLWLHKQLSSTPETMLLLIRFILKGINKTRAGLGNEISENSIFYIRLYSYLKSYITGIITFPQNINTEINNLEEIISTLVVVKNPKDRETKQNLLSTFVQKQQQSKIALYKSIIFAQTIKESSQSSLSSEITIRAIKNFCINSLFLEQYQLQENEEFIKNPSKNNKEPIYYFEDELARKLYREIKIKNTDVLFEFLKDDKNKENVEIILQSILEVYNLKSAVSDPLAFKVEFPYIHIKKAGCNEYISINLSKGIINLEKGRDQKELPQEARELSLIVDYFGKSLPPGINCGQQSNDNNTTFKFAYEKIWYELVYKKNAKHSELYKTIEIDDQQQTFILIKDTASSIEELDILLPKTLLPNRHFVWRKIQQKTPNYPVDNLCAYLVEYEDKIVYIKSNHSARQLEKTIPNESVKYSSSGYIISKPNTTIPELKNILTQIENIDNIVIYYDPNGKLPFKISLPRLKMEFYYDAGTQKIFLTNDPEFTLCTSQNSIIENFSGLLYLEKTDARTQERRHYAILPAWGYNKSLNSTINKKLFILDPNINIDSYAHIANIETSLEEYNYNKHPYAKLEISFNKDGTFKELLGHSALEYLLLAHTYIYNHKPQAAYAALIICKTKYKLIGTTSELKVLLSLVEATNLPLEYNEAYNLTNAKTACDPKTIAVQTMAAAMLAEFNQKNQKIHSHAESTEKKSAASNFFKKYFGFSVTRFKTRSFELYDLYQKNRNNIPAFMHLNEIEELYLLREFYLVQERVTVGPYAKRYYQLERNELEKLKPLKETYNIIQNNIALPQQRERIYNITMQYEIDINSIINKIHSLLINHNISKLTDLAPARDLQLQGHEILSNELEDLNNRYKNWKQFGISNTFTLQHDSPKQLLENHFLDLFVLAQSSETPDNIKLELENYLVNVIKHFGAYIKNHENINYHQAENGEYLNKLLDKPYVLICNFLLEVICRNFYPLKHYIKSEKAYDSLTKPLRSFKYNKNIDDLVLKNKLTKINNYQQGCNIIEDYYNNMFNEENERQKDNRYYSRQNQYGHYFSLKEKAKSSILEVFKSEHIYNNEIKFFLEDFINDCRHFLEKPLGSKTITFNHNKIQTNYTIHKVIPTPIIKSQQVEVSLKVKDNQVLNLMLSLKDIECEQFINHYLSLNDTTIAYDKVVFNISKGLRDNKKRAIEKLNSDYQAGAKYNQIEKLKKQAAKEYFEEKFYEAYEESYNASINEYNILQTIKEELNDKIVLPNEKRQTELLNKILFYANEKHHKNETIRQQARKTDIYGNKREELKLNSLIRLFLKNNLFDYKELTLLNDDEVAKLHNMICNYLILATNTNHAKRTIKLISQAQSLEDLSTPNQQEIDSKFYAIAESLVTKRQYDPTVNPLSLIFEYYENITIRPNQQAMLKSLTAKQDGKYTDSIAQLMMGDGKSKLIAPLLLLEATNGNNLVIFDVPEALLETNFQDINRTVQSLFGVECHKFYFSRMHPHSSSDLELMYKTLHTYVANKQFIVTSGTCIQSLELKYFELLNQAITTVLDRELYLQIVWLQRIDNLIEKHADFICDEVDMRLSRTKQLVYAAGQEKLVDKTIVNDSCELYSFILDKQFFIKDGKYSFLQLVTHEAPLPTNEEWDSLFAEIIELLINDAKSPLAPIVSILKSEHNTKAEQQQLIGSLKTFLYPSKNFSNKEAEAAFKAKSYDKIDNLFRFIETPDHRNIVSLYKFYLTALLQSTLPKENNFHYGKSFLIPDHDPNRRFLAIPYSGVKSPKENSKYAVEETILLTLNDILQSKEGIDYKLFEEAMKAIYEEAIQEFDRLKGKYIQLGRIKEAKSLTINDTEVAKNFAQIIGNNDFNVSDFEYEPDFFDFSAEQYKKAHKSLKTNYRLSIEIYRRYVLPLIRFDEFSVMANPYTYTRQIHGKHSSFRGFTGTPNPDEYDVKLNFDEKLSFGTDGRTIDHIISKNPILTEVDNLTIYNFLKINFEQCKQSNSIQAIIDNGLFKDVDNLSAAREIASFLKDNNPSIEWVLFFDEFDVLCALNIEHPLDTISIGSSSPDNIAEMLKIKDDEGAIHYEKYFTYYDQRHTTGTDIKQAPTAIAIETFSILTTLRDILQATMRMRDFSNAQSVVFVIGGALRKLYPNKKWTVKEILQHVYDNQFNKYSENYYYGTIEFIKAVIRADIKRRIKNCADVSKSLILFKNTQHYFLKTEIMEPFAKHGAIESWAKTDVLLEQAASKALSDWQSILEQNNIKITDNEYDLLTSDIYKAIARGKKVCAEFAKSSKTCEQIGHELEIQIEKDIDIEEELDKEVQIAKEEVKNTQKINFNPHAVAEDLINISINELLNLEMKKDETISTTLNKVNRIVEINDIANEYLFAPNSIPHEEQFTFSSNVVITPDAYKSVLDEKLKPHGAFSIMGKNIQLLFRLNPINNNLKALIVSDKESDYLNNLMVTNEHTLKSFDGIIWLQTVSGELQFGHNHTVALADINDKESNSVLRKKYNKIIEQVALVNANWDILNKLLTSANDATWLRENPSEKIAVIVKLNSQVPSIERTAYENLCSKLQKVAEKLPSSIVSNPIFVIDYVNISSREGIKFLRYVNQCSMLGLSVHIICPLEQKINAEVKSLIDNKKIKLQSVADAKSHIINLFNHSQYRKQAKIILSSDKKLINSFYEPNAIDNIEMNKYLVRIYADLSKNKAPIHSESDNIFVNLITQIAKVVATDQSNRKGYSRRMFASLNLLTNKNNPNEILPTIQADLKSVNFSIKEEYIIKRKKAKKLLLPKNKNRLQQLDFIEEFSKIYANTARCSAISSKSLLQRQNALIGAYLCVCAEIEHEKPRKASTLQEILIALLQTLQDEDNNPVIFSKIDYKEYKYYRKTLELFVNENAPNNLVLKNFIIQSPNSRLLTAKQTFRQIKYYLNKGSYIKAKDLLNQNMDALNYQDDDGRNLLQIAVEGNHSYFMQYLVLKGVILNTDQYNSEFIARIDNNIIQKDIIMALFENKNNSYRKLYKVFPFNSKAQLKLQETLNSIRVKQYLSATFGVISALLIASGIFAAIFFTGGLALIPNTILGFTLSYYIKISLTAAISSIIGAAIGGLSGLFAYFKYARFMSKQAKKKLIEKVEAEFEDKDRIRQADKIYKELVSANEFLKAHNELNLKDQILDNISNLRAFREKNKGAMTFANSYQDAFNPINPTIINIKDELKKMR